MKPVITPNALCLLSAGAKLFGVGIGKGTAKYNEGVPVAWTDSIFVVIAEETGLIGALIVVGLYMLLLYEGLKIAKQCARFAGTAPRPQALHCGLALKPWLISAA